IVARFDLHPDFVFLQKQFYGCSNRHQVAALQQVSDRNSFVWVIQYLYEKLIDTFALVWDVSGILCHRQLSHHSSRERSAARRKSTMMAVIQCAAMKIKLWSCAFALGALLIASNCLAQNVPVSMQAPASTNDDQTALRFSKSLSDEIQLSGKFYLWTGKYYDLPPNGVRIMVRSIQVTLRNGDELGSAIFVEAERPSGKDLGYYKVVSEQLWMIPKDSSVAD